MAAAGSRPRSAPAPRPAAAAGSSDRAGAAKPAGPAGGAAGSCRGPPAGAASRTGRRSGKARRRRCPGGAAPDKVLPRRSGRSGGAGANVAGSRPTAGQVNNFWMFRSRDRCSRSGRRSTRRWRCSRFSARWCTAQLPLLAPAIGKSAGAADWRLAPQGCSGAGAAIAAGRRWSSSARVDAGRPGTGRENLAQNRPERIENRQQSQQNRDRAARRSSQSIRAKQPRQFLAGKSRLGGLCHHSSVRLGDLGLGRKLVRLWRRADRLQLRRKRLLLRRPGLLRRPADRHGRRICRAGRGNRHVLRRA